ncbi:hypothetical protein [Alteriqipengyuania sp. 357]
MGLLVLLSTGAVLGWLVALVTGAEHTRAAWLRIGLGSVSTVVTGALVSESSLIHTLGANALLLAIVCACIVLALVSVMEPLTRR